MNYCFEVCGNLLFFSKCSNLKLFNCRNLSNKKNETDKNTTNNNTSSNNNQTQRNTIYDSLLNPISRGTPDRTPFLNNNLRLQSLDVIPRKSGILDGDWILKFSDANVNTYPWQRDRSHFNFELTPWRSSKTNVQADPQTNSGWAPMPIKWNVEEEEKILSKLRKKQNKALTKKSVKSTRSVKIKKRGSLRSHQGSFKMKVKNDIKARMVFALEVQNSQKRGTEKCLPTVPLSIRHFSKSPFNTRKEAVSVAIEELESKQHCYGYFSQRNVNIYDIIDKFQSTNSLCSDYKTISKQKKVNQAKKVVVSYCVGEQSQHLGRCCTSCRRYAINSTRVVVEVKAFIFLRLHCVCIESS